MKNPPEGGIATPKEVLESLTSILRGEGGEKPSEQLKAAESLARHYGILTPREDKAPPKAEVAEEIEAAMRRLEEADDGRSGA